MEKWFSGSGFVAARDARRRFGFARTATAGSATAVRLAARSPGAGNTVRPTAATSRVRKAGSTTGIGSGSYTAYSGGSCNGANFDSSGASEIGSGTIEFVVTKGGRQVNVALTSLQNSTNSLGSVSLFDTDLKQTK